MDSLKPCPFCGSDLLTIENADTHAVSWVACGECTATAGYARDVEIAVRDWNRRAMLSDAIIKADFEARPMDKP